MKAYRLSLDVRAPIFTAGTAMGAFAVDQTVLREPDGTPALAGSHVTGKLREALHLLAASEGASFGDDDVDDWFGPPPKQAGEQPDARVFADPRKRVIIGDLRAVAMDPDHRFAERCSERELEHARARDRIRSRIAIHPVTFAASDGALLVEEEPFAPGTVVRFEGTLWIVAGEQARAADEIARPLRSGLAWLSQVGGNRTVGYGRVMATALEPRRARSVQTPRAPRPEELQAGRWRLALRFMDPFCIARPPRYDNLFEGSEVVPGGVVKGALARQVRTLVGGDPRGVAPLRDLPGDAFASLRRHFDALRITHLFPVSAPGLPADVWDGDLAAHVPPLARPATPGLGVVEVGREWRDWSLLAQAPAGARAAFQPDLKEARLAALRAQFGWPTTQRELRVHTQMDGDERAAATGALFAYELVRPEDHLWLGHLDLCDVPEDARTSVVRDLVIAVRDGLVGLGKTAAAARVAAVPGEARTPQVGIDRRGRTVVVLESPALLCVADDLCRAGDDPDGSKALLNGYRATFDQLSGGTLRLAHFFATQELAGGEHAARRSFRGRAYEPFVLTSAGSTFVFEPGDPQKAHEVLDGWRYRGLEVAPRILAHYGWDGRNPGRELHRLCPFLPQNGYGEVRIDGPLYDCALEAPA